MCVNPSVVQRGVETLKFPKIFMGSPRFRLTVNELEGEESQVLGAQVCTGRPEVHCQEVPRLDRRGDGTLGGHLAVAAVVEAQAAVEEQNP